MDLMRRIAPLACGLLVTIPTSHVDASTALTSVTLRWTAPGDDGMIGRAQAYILVRSLAPITEANYSAATVISGVPAPQPAGSAETFTVTGLTPNTGYYFAIKTVDDAGLISPISNVVFHSGQTTGVADPSPAPSLSAPWPNPARHGTRWAYVLPQAAMVQVDVFDVAGRHVRAIASGQRAAGRGELDWDLRDDAGAPVAAGLYLVRARLGGPAWTRRLMVVR